MSKCIPGDDFKTSYSLPSDPGKYCIVVNYVVFEANKIKFKTKTETLNSHILIGTFLPVFQNVKQCQNM